MAQVAGNYLSLCLNFFDRSFSIRAHKTFLFNIHLTQVPKRAPKDFESKDKVSLLNLKLS